MLPINNKNIQKVISRVLLNVAFVLLPAVALADVDISDPKMSDTAKQVAHEGNVFGPDPEYKDTPYSVEDQLEIYGGKRAVPTPRPMLELGQRIYDSGPLQASSTGWGEKNPSTNDLAIYGDWRTAIAWNHDGVNSKAILATRLNIDVDWKLTGTERVHAFFRPLDKNGDFSNCILGGTPRSDCDVTLDFTADALFFEGDLGAIAAGFSNEYSSFDLPFAVGKMPLLFQNGVWMEDTIDGVAFTIPAGNSPSLDISNYDVTFFAGFSNVDGTGTIKANGKATDNDVDIYGVTSFIDATSGYWELGYAYTDTKGATKDQDHHNFAIAFSRRYGGWLSNSVRFIHTFGQKRKNGQRKTADGSLLLIENSFVTSKPSTIIPYFNLFFSSNKPQSIARDAGAGGILKNTGINFETDGLTGFPTLDATADNTWGGALGVEYLFALDQQLVAEIATVQVRGSAGKRTAKGDQYALGLRYQLPLNKRWLIRADAMVASRDNDEDLSGIRFEIRRKW